LQALSTDLSDQLNSADVAAGRVLGGMTVLL